MSDLAPAPTTDPSALQATVLKTLDWAYDKALDGVAGPPGLPSLDSATELARPYTKDGASRWDQAGSLVRWQATKAGTAGFLTNVGGALALPVTLPANLAVVAYVQLRMTAALAHMGGLDVHDDRVKTMCVVCLTGNAATEVVKDFGVKAGTKLTESAVRKVSGETIKAINQRVGFRLLTKYGTTGLLNLGRLVPFAGGVLNGCFDAAATLAVGKVARRSFIERDGSTDPAVTL